MRVTLNLQGVLGFLSAKRQEETYIDFMGDKVGDLVNHLLSKMGPDEKQMLLNEQGELSPELSVLLNGRPIYGPNRLNQKVREGDLIELDLSAG